MLVRVINNPKKKTLKLNEQSLTKKMDNVNKCEQHFSVWVAKTTE